MHEYICSAIKWLRPVMTIFMLSLEGHIIDIDWSTTKSALYPSSFRQVPGKHNYSSGKI